MLNWVYFQVVYFKISPKYLMIINHDTKFNYYSL